MFETELQEMESFTADNKHNELTSQPGDSTIAAASPTTDDLERLVRSKPSISHTQPGSVTDSDQGGALAHIDPATGFVKSNLT